MLKWRARLPQACRYLLIVAVFAGPGEATAQSQAPHPESPISSKDPAAKQRPPDSSNDSHAEKLEKKFLPNLAGDQRHIWTSPFRLRARDAFWLAPAAAATGSLIHFDPQMFGDLRHGEASARNHLLASDAGVLVLGGTVGGMYVLGRIHSNDHLRETGVLGTQALVNTLGVTYAAKYALGRQRPYAGDLQGDFFRRGESFPSLHASSAWALASVVAHEYPGILTQIGVYGVASAVSITRVTGGRHFPSDVLVGSALGWAIGRSVYRRHHAEQDAMSASIGSIVRDDDEPLRQSRFGSPYVPLDVAWIYDSFDRLAALGVAPSAFAGLRPWTRDECARLIRAAEDLAADADAQRNAEARRHLDPLRAEFARELREDHNKEPFVVTVDSLYLRGTGVGGVPLNDGYHYGQTQYNDYGRPLREGLNLTAGFDGYAIAGAWTFYVRAEFQHAPSAGPLSDDVRIHNAIADGTPIEAAQPFARVNRVRLLDAYAAYNFRDWQLSFGKQSLWWGQAKEGSLLFSNNAEPFPMVRLSRVRPAVLPWILHYLGPFRAEVFFGQLDGHRYVRTSTALYGPGLSRQPLIHGGRLAFKPTANLEFGVGVTTVFAGPGVKFNARTFLSSLGFSNAIPGEPNDPGDRRSSFDFKYRLPGLRNRAVLYADAMTEDELSPIAYPRRSAFNAGLYLARLPHLPRMDLRLEGVYTDLPGLRAAGSYYFNNRYLNGYTNEGNLMGHWIGREGVGYNAKTTFWVNGRNHVGVRFRGMRVGKTFTPGGGNLKDIEVSTGWAPRPQWEFSARAQVERWSFPVLSPRPEMNFTGAVQVVFRPQVLWARGRRQK